MTTQSERKMASDILRTLADEIDAMPDNPLKHEVQSTIYDLFIVMKLIDDWGD